MTTYLITGCSSGFGRAIAEEALRRGDQVIVTARDTDAVADIVAEHPDRALAVALDVTDDVSVSAAVAAGLQRFGAIDVLINNAGYGLGGAVEETDRSEVDALFETNFFGAVRTIHAVLPGMRERRSGTIVTISSNATRTMAPGGGFYSAVKAAISALSGSLRKELAPLGIGVVVVQPGVFDTDFHGRSMKMAQRQISAYDDVLQRGGGVPGNGRPSDPRLGAKAILRVIESSDLPALLLLGEDAVERFISHRASEKDDVDRFETLSRSVRS